MNRARWCVIIAVVGLQRAPAPHRGEGAPDGTVAAELVELNTNGAWSWFSDPSVVVNEGKLLVGSVRADGRMAGTPRSGNVEVSVYDLATGRVDVAVLHPSLEQDDHDAPAFHVRRDGRILAMYGKHARERRVYWRLSEPHDPLAWGPEQTMETPGRDVEYAGDNTTYANLFSLPDGRLYNFLRAVGHDPNYLVSEDDGTTWTYGGRWLRGSARYSPYVKFAADRDHNLHFVVTEDHPRMVDNSVYHGVLRAGTLYRTDGAPVCSLSTTMEPSCAPRDFTKIFAGTPDHVAWLVDLEIDDRGRPYALLSTQEDGRGLPPGQGGMDLRYHYARLGATGWEVDEIAYAGRRLYPTEDDYTGLGALDPNDPDTVYLSTDADPKTGAPLVSASDGLRHHEIVRGRRETNGSWTFTPVTRNSKTDNLRPLVPRWKDERTALVWMRGEYVHNHGEWYTAVVAAILPAADEAPQRSAERASGVATRSAVSPEATGR